jgi:hypothetical protein
VRALIAPPQNVFWFPTTHFTVRRPTRVPLALGFLLVPIASFGSNPFGWVDREVLKRIDITGQRVLGYHSHEVSGDVDAFRSLTYFGRGGDRFTDRGQMTIAGRKVFGLVNFQMSFSDNRYDDPQAQRVSVDYERDGLTVNAGDIRGSLLNTNSFVPFTKTMKGIQVGYGTGRFSARAIRSESRNSAQTVSLQGNGSMGPYYLRSSQLVADSVQVRVDDQPMRLGQDFTVNHQVGSITFVSKVIPQTSTIVVSYEAFGFNTASGTVQGAGASYDLGPYGRLGVTAIEQRAGGRRGLDTRQELFQGFGAPATPYTLQFEPLMDPGLRPVIKVDGVLQFEGGDYFFDAGTSSIFYFGRFIPASSTVEVVYTPKPTATLDGDRRVIGLDYSIPLGAGGRAGRITLSQATGSLSNTATPLQGTARGIAGDYQTGNLRFRGAVRDIPQGFVSVESRGFSRNERAVDFGLDYVRGPLQYGLSHVNSSIASRRTNPSGDIIFSRHRSTNSRASASFRESEAASWNLDHTRSTSLVSGGETRLDSTKLSTQRRIGAVNTRFGLEHLDGYGPLSRGGAVTWDSIKLDTFRLNADTSLGGRWSLGGRASVSDVRTGEEKRTGHDIALSTSYTGPGPWSMSASYSVSKAGELAALAGFQSGLGLGYEGNGFTGAPPSTAFGGGATDFRLWQVESAYRVSPRITLDGRFFSSRSEGSVGSNTDTSGYGLGIYWDLGGSHTLTTSIYRSRTLFIGSTGIGTTSLRSDATTFNASLAGAFGRRWSYNLGTGILLSGGSSFAQDNLEVGGYLRYLIDERSLTGLEFRAGRTTGYLPQNDSYLGMFYERQIYGNVSLVGSYKLRNLRNLDPLQSQGAYRSSGFDIELRFNFFGGRSGW